MTKFDAVSREYATLWDTMQIVRDESVMTRTVEKIIACRSAYEEVEKLTGVPWYFVGICDMREGGGGARRHLHNGDSLARPTVQVPANRPPGKGPFTFIQSAVDALQIKGLDKITAWPIERLAYEFERFNGFGYRSARINIPSPYLWGGTNHQQPGKYIRDHVFSKTVMDTQHGCMPLLKLIAAECDVLIPSIYGATANAAEPSPASNSKAEQPGMSPAEKVAYTTGGTLTVASIERAINDPAGTMSTLVAVKGSSAQLLSGVSFTGVLAPMLILTAALGAAYFWGRK